MFRNNVDPVSVLDIGELKQVFTRANHFMPKQRPGEYEFRYKRRLAGLQVAVDLVDILTRQARLVTVSTAQLAKGGALFRGRIDHTGTFDVSGRPPHYSASVEEVLDGAQLVGEHLALVELLCVVGEPVAGVCHLRIVVALANGITELKLNI